MASFTEYVNAEVTSERTDKLEQSTEKPKIDKNLISAIVAVLEKRKVNKADKQSETDSEHVITHFSPELVRTLSQTDQIIQKNSKALKGPEKGRTATGSL